MSSNSGDNEVASNLIYKTYFQLKAIVVHSFLPLFTLFYLIVDSMTFASILLFMSP